MLRQVLVGLLLVSLPLNVAGTPAVTTAQTQYDLTIPGSIDTPPREVTIEGQTHTVSAVARSAPGNDLGVTVTAPADASYQVLLYNGDRQIEDSKDGTGEQSVQFDLKGYEPGSYLVALYKDGDYKAVHPVVVRGYTVTVTDVPPRAETNSQFAVSVTAQKVENVEEPESVSVVLASGEHDVQVTATHTSGQTYEAALSLETFPPGDARVYAVVQGSDTAFTDDRKEVLGMSDTTTVSIYEPTTTTTTTPPSSPTATTVGGSPTTTPSTKTPAPNTTTTTNPDPTKSMSTTATSTSPTENTTTSTTSATDDDVITPNQSTTTPSPTTPGIPGFTLVGTALALLCAGLLAVRRYHR
jgi:hypothetical protein